MIRYRYEPWIISWVDHTTQMILGQTLQLQFDDTNKSLVLKISPAESLLSLEDAFHIRFRYSDIDDILFDHQLEVSKLLFRLRTPVSYERLESELLNQLANMGSTERRPSRIRLTSLPFDDNHNELAKYISRNILISLPKPAAVEFERLCELARVARPWKKQISVTQSSMFAPTKILQIERWISKQKWEVAFQVCNNVITCNRTYAVFHTILARKNLMEHAPKSTRIPPHYTCLQ